MFFCFLLCCLKLNQLGRIHLLNWFDSHRCNEYCNKNWLKPSNEELNSIPKEIRKFKEKSTTHRTAGNTIIGKTMNFNMLTIIGSENNPYKQYYKYGIKKHLNESILLAGKGDRWRWNTWEKSVIILTSHGRLIIVNAETERFESILSDNILVHKLKVTSDRLLRIKTNNNEMKFRCNYANDITARKWVTNIKETLVSN